AVCAGTSPRRTTPRAKAPLGIGTSSTSCGSVCSSSCTGCNEEADSDSRFAGRTEELATHDPRVTNHESRPRLAAEPVRLNQPLRPSDDPQDEERDGERGADRPR